MFRNVGFCLLLLTIVYPAYGYYLYGHRGARGLAPENTLIGYQVALATPVDYVDMDVVMTADKVVVVHHGLALDPNITRDQHGRWLSENHPIYIKNLTFKQLQTYDVGRIKPNSKYHQYFPQQLSVDRTAIPSLQQVIQYVKAHAGNRVGFQIEIKTDPEQPLSSFSPEEMASSVYNIMQQEHILKRTQVQAFDWRCLLALQKIDPMVVTAYLTDLRQEKRMKNPDPRIAGLWTAGYRLQAYHNSIPEMIHALGGKYWDPEDQEVNLTDINKAHRLGLKVVVWSSVEREKIDLDVRMIRKLIRLGVDGIITDRPDHFLNQRIV